MLKITNRTSDTMVSLGDAQSMYAHCVRYQGNLYWLVKKSTSRHTENLARHVAPGFIPLLNIKSQTLRAVLHTEEVELVDAEVIITKFTHPPTESEG